MYHYKKESAQGYEDTVQKTRDELTRDGFGILTEIDIKATLKKKLDVDVDDYLILGACNPPFAHKALEAEQDIGLLLPCNVVVYKKEGKVLVSAILPTVAMGMIDNPSVKKIAGEIEDKLKKVIDAI